MAKPREADELELVRLTDCADNAEAGLVQSLLEAEGIFVNLSGAHHRSLVTAIGSHIRIDVWVQRRDLERAKALLAERDRGELAPADPEALAAEAEAAEGPEVERLEEGPAVSEEQLAASARRRRRTRKLGAWVLLIGPLPILVVVFGYQAAVRAFRLDWVELKRPQLQVRFPLKPYATSKTIADGAGKSYQRDDYTSLQVGTECSYSLRVISPGFGNADAEARAMDQSVQSLRAELGGATPDAAAVKVQGFLARELTTRGALDGHPVELRARWIAGPTATLIQMMVCKEGSFSKEDADAFFSSLVLTAG